MDQACRLGSFMLPFASIYSAVAVFFVTGVGLPAVDARSFQSHLELAGLLPCEYRRALMMQSIHSCGFSPADALLVGGEEGEAEMTRAIMAERCLCLYS